MSTQASPSEEHEVFLDASKLSPFEYVGMAAGLVLLVSLWLPWFSTGSNKDAAIFSAGIGPDSTANAWQTFGILPWALLALSSAPFILSWIVARRHKLDWPTGEVTMVTGLIGTFLVLCNGLILGKPEPGIQVSLSLGWFLALAGCTAIFVTGLMRQAEKSSNRPRKPPGTI